MTQFCPTFQRLKSFSYLSVTALWLLGSASLSTAEPAPQPLSWYERSQLSAEEQEGLPEFCRGRYRLPVITAFDNARIEAEADHSNMTRNGDTQLNGNVVLQQYDRVLRSDRAYWYQSRGYGEFFGQVSLTTPQLVMQGNEAALDQNAGTVQFSQAEYSMPARHLRGTADRVETLEGGTINFTRATLTFCEPGQNDWDIAASSLHLDQNKGIGSAWNTRLRIAEVPVLYVPYYRFPIGDQRMTGFLNPSLSVTSKLQAEDIQLPFYLNLAPNADATITPHYVREHGTVLETQFRHKTRLLGDGELNYAYLDQDKTDDSTRWLVNYKQNGRFGQGWEHRWVYNNVSDEDYLNDMSPTAAVDRTTHLPRRGEIIWNSRHWHFDVTAESFQTIDRNIALRNRPYSRLPQLNLNYIPLRVNEWQFQQDIQITRFSRKEEDRINGIDQTLSGFDALNGDRLASNSRLSYPLEWPFGFLTPAVEYRQRSYNLTNADNTLDADFDQHPSIGSPRYSLDAGLYFDRDTQWLGRAYQQTLEPRIFWVNSPYVSGQNNIPNFDNSRITVNYNSLFTGERFTGGDRLADLDQVSAGVTTRFIRDDGFEQFRASAGQIFYRDERRVQLERQLTGTHIPLADTRSTSSLLAEVEWNPDENWSVYSTTEWDPYEEFAVQNRQGVRYEYNNHMLNVANNITKRFNATTDRAEVTSNQLDTGVFWSLSDRWALVGHMLYDNRSYADAAKQPRSRILESLAGLEYQNCCWRMQITYRESSLQETDSNIEYTTRKRYGFLFSIQLKGLGNLGASTDRLITDSIPGYSRRQYHDH